MNARQRNFAREYIKNGRIGYQAVFAAGYKQGYNSACVTASRLLRKAKIKSMIDAVEERANTEAELTAERVSREVAKVAFAHVKEIDSKTKMQGLSLASQILGMVTQKVETTDTSAKDAIKDSILQAVNSAANRDNLSKSATSIALFEALSDLPGWKSPENWGEYQPIIEQFIAEKTAESPLIEGGEQ